MTIYIFGLLVVGSIIGFFTPISWILISLVIPLFVLISFLKESNSGFDGIGQFIFLALAFWLYLGTAIGYGTSYLTGVDIDVSIRDKGVVEKVVQPVEESSDINWTKVWNYKPFGKDN